MPATVLILWCAQILLQSFAAVRIWSGGLVNRFPILTTWFATTSISTLVLLIARQFNPPAYPALYSIACLFQLLLEAGCIVEVFFALCGKFRNFARIGGGLLLILWLIAGASSAAVRLSWVPSGWTRTWQIVMLGTRYADLAMIIVLACAWLILRIAPVRTPRSANLATMIVLGHAAYGFVISSITITNNDNPYLWMSMLPLLGGCLTATAAAVLLRSQPGEYVLPPAPSREQFQAALRDADVVYEQFRRRAADLLRRMPEEF